MQIIEQAISPMTQDRAAKAEETRTRILEVAGEEMLRVGFRAMGLNDVLQKLKMSKGALYHHFQNKLELGYAVLDELYAKRFLNIWVSPLDREDPLQATIDCLEQMGQGLDPMLLQCGCPINNLANEMSAIDEGFRLRLERIFKRWKAKLTEALILAQQKGYMREDADVEETAVFVITAVQGAIILTKSTRDFDVLTMSTNMVAKHLKSLQTTPTAH